jgi:hypothetical protein
MKCVAAIHNIARRDQSVFQLSVIVKKPKESQETASSRAPNPSIVVRPTARCAPEIKKTAMLGMRFDLEFPRLAKHRPARALPRRRSVQKSVKGDWFHILPLIYAISPFEIKAHNHQSPPC